VQLTCQIASWSRRGATTLSISTFSIMTLSITTLFVTLSIMTRSIKGITNTHRTVASAIMLSIAVFNVMLSVVMLSVVAPQKDLLCSGFVTQVCQYLVQLGTCQKLMIEPANPTFTSGANRSLGFAFSF
jgi:hypothetical protein